MFTSRHGSATRDEFWSIVVWMVTGVSILTIIFVYLMMR